jgi:hypothetical protein
VPRGWGELVDDARVDRCPVGGDLDRRQAAGQGASEEHPRSRGVAASRDEHIQAVGDAEEAAFASSDDAAALTGQPDGESDDHPVSGPTEHIGASGYESNDERS